MSDNNRPIETIRDGRYKASVWSNEGENGPYLSVKFAKTYTDASGKAQDTQTFSDSDLLQVAEVARETYRVTRDLRQELRAEYGQAQTRNQAPPTEDRAAPNKSQGDADTGYQRQPRGRTRSYAR
ncbi:MAG: hypothetical protein AAFW83_12740 [Pseudomonadota bacterium]